MSSTDNDAGRTSQAAALMDQVYRHQRHIYDLTRKYYLLGRDRLIDRLEPPVGGTVLELGCGTGRNLIAAARRHPAARFYGLDISAEMLETARANIARAGLSSRITLACADATTFDAEALFGRATFDRVFFSYALSMIPPWREALAAGYGAVAPGGVLSLVDFGQQERLPRWFRTLLLAWLARFHVSPRAETAEAVAALAEARGATASGGPLYRGYAVWAELRRPPVA
ncbi:methyltransferase domain-containing protein [Microvirga tunisiensis]|uniref:Methyltransferase domain-containing protein n=1 Tax=Pannonibacter tanglangensis TaxID=2750084 RepID=A0A7X5F364_9HYPH|nr:class I SAM-dependent methyltransferase [Pannonibacter sp. XCT-53]NBN78891.1 methyltransferase domain-containing protein [Pannonibacter sp. XCT-53]